MDLVGDVLINKLLGAKRSTQVGPALRSDIHMGTWEDFSCPGQMCDFGYELCFPGVGMVAIRRSNRG